MNKIAKQILISTQGQPVPWIFPVAFLDDSRVVARVLATSDQWRIPGVNFWAGLLNATQWKPDGDEQIWILLEQAYPEGDGMPQGHPTSGWEIVSGWTMKVWALQSGVHVAGIHSSFRYNPVIPEDKVAVKLRRAMLWVISDLLKVDVFDVRQLSVTSQTNLLIPRKFTLERELVLTLGQPEGRLRADQERFLAAMKSLSSSTSDKTAEYWRYLVNCVNSYLESLAGAGFISHIEPTDENVENWREWILYLGGPYVFSLMLIYEDEGPEPSIEWTIGSSDGSDIYATGKTPWIALTNAHILVSDDESDDWLSEASAESEMLFDPSLLDIYTALQAPSPFAQTLDKLHIWGKQLGLLS